uniref:Uncharacterized protein n=1 Tax=Tanacetum cinerariifolium TaxID=118510 RepID=A0A6L2M8M6_TANCI|nr:hypothetical protein [Tanacetum cinerariifolium]
MLPTQVHMYSEVTCAHIQLNVEVNDEEIACAHMLLLSIHMFQCLVKMKKSTHAHVTNMVKRMHTHMYAFSTIVGRLPLNFLFVRATTSTSL